MDASFRWLLTGARAGCIAPLLLLCACGGGGGDSSRPGPAGPGQAPIAAFSSGGATAGTAPFSVSFDAGGSSDPDGRISSYSWSFGDGQTGAGAQVTHEFLADQTYTVTLAVTDDQMLTASARSIVAAGGDPLFPLQWHLDNRGQSGGLVGQDVGVLPVWAGCGDAAGCRGEGVRIAVVDDGLELAHEDLTANIVAGASYDYTTGDSDPTPADAGDAHGTAIAGIVAGRDGNGLGGRGVVPRAELVGYNLLQNAILSNQADAMIRGGHAVDVSTNSWGARDGLGNLQPSDFSWRTAIESGIQTGRGGLGIVYAWAAGNGDRRVSSDGRSLPVDNSNYDGQANFYGVMAVAALDDQGRKAGYSEPGANIWISAPGGDSCASGDAIVTTDLSGGRGLNPGTGSADLQYGNYTACMNGTSSATPMVAGVAALVLQARPDLSWRDVKLILAESARRTDAGDPDWITNGEDIPINHKYGFGAVDAQAAVALASGWSLLPPLRIYGDDESEIAASAPKLAIPDNDETGVSDQITVAGSGIGDIEFVEVYFSAAHSYSGDLEITLTKVATGTNSVLAETHLCQCRGEVHDNWRFGSARHLGEAADGNWRLTVKDRNGVDEGTFQGWRLVFYGH